MEFDDIAGAVGDPGRRAPPSPSNVHPARLAEPERQSASAAFNPASVSKARRVDGSPPEMSSQKNRPAATCLPTSSASAAGRTPDASMIIAVMDRLQNAWRAANGSAWKCAGPAPAKTDP